MPPAAEEQIPFLANGHQTESVYRWYDIISDRDLRSAATRLEVYIGEQMAETANPENSAKDGHNPQSPAPLPDCKLLKELVSRAGIEPATTALKDPSGKCCHGRCRYFSATCNGSESAD